MNTYISFPAVRCSISIFPQYPWLIKLKYHQTHIQFSTKLIITLHLSVFEGITRRWTSMEPICTMSTYRTVWRMRLQEKHTLPDKYLLIMSSDSRLPLSVARCWLALVYTILKLVSLLTTILWLNDVIVLSQSAEILLELYIVIISIMYTDADFFLYSSANTMRAALRLYV